MRFLLIPSLSSQIGLSLTGLVHVTLRVSFPLPLVRHPKESWPQEANGGEARNSCKRMLRILKIPIWLQDGRKARQLYTLSGNEMST